MALLLVYPRPQLLPSLLSWRRHYVGLSLVHHVAEAVKDSVAESLRHVGGAIGGATPALGLGARISHDIFCPQRHHNLVDVLSKLDDNRRHRKDIVGMHHSITKRTALSQPEKCKHLPGGVDPVRRGETKCVDLIEELLFDP